jgi:CMP-N-acetylneuraminic acid synthetase
MKEGKILAILPVRKNSKRVAFKNLKKFSDSNLLEIKLKVLKSIEIIDNILVSSDWDEALDIAKNYNVLTHEREKYYASSECSSDENIKYITNYIKTLPENYKYLLYTPVTSPLIKKNTIINFINKYFTINDKYKSMVTTTKLNKFLYFKNKPLNFNIHKFSKSQDLYFGDIILFSLSINTLENQLKTFLIDENPYFYNLSDIEAIDIDYPIDFEIAEFLYNRYRKREI